MSQLYFFFCNWFFNLYTYTYVYLEGLITAILFYPLGIALACYLLFWSAYMILSLSKSIRYFIKVWQYLINFKYKLLLLCDFLFALAIFKSLWELINTVVFFFSEYYIVFFIKKHQFYIFLITTSCVYILL